ncbi:MAG: extracellular solute-binding protein [Caldilineaceae bacterium]
MQQFSRRDFLRLAGAGTTLATLAACTPAGMPGQQAGEAEGAAAGETVQLAWIMRSQPRENEWEEERVATYQSENPGVEINLIIVPFNEMDPKLNTMIAAGTPPDIFSQWGESGFGDYYARDLLLDLTPFIEADDYSMDQFLPSSVEPYVRDGKYYSTPQVNNFAIMLFYNKDLFDAAGLAYPTTDWNDSESWNWNIMLEYAQTLTKNYGEGLDAEYGANLTRDIHHLAYLFAGDAFTPEHYETGLSQTSQLDSDVVIEAVQSRADMVFDLQVSPSPADLESLSQLGDIFMTGKIGMVTSGSWGMRVFQDAPFRFGVAPLPGMRDNKRYAFTGSWLIAREAPEPDAAWTFVKYLLSEESCTGLAEVGFGSPRTNINRDVWLPKYADKTEMSIDELESVIFGSVDYSVEHVNHLFVGWPQITQTITQDADPIWLGSATAADVLTGTKEKLDVVLQNIYTEFSGT